MIENFNSHSKNYLVYSSRDCIRAVGMFLKIIFRWDAKHLGVAGFARFKDQLRGFTMMSEGTRREDDFLDVDYKIESGIDDNYWPWRN